VRYLVREEIEKMMKMGGEIVGMMYNSTATFNQERECTKPDHMRISFLKTGVKITSKRFILFFIDCLVEPMRTS
jgi:hypothetical protein